MSPFLQGNSDFVILSRKNIHSGPLFTILVIKYNMEAIHMEDTCILILHGKACFYHRINVITYVTTGCCLTDNKKIY